MKKSRKSFLNILLGSSLVAFFGSLFYPVTKYLIPPFNTSVQPTSIKIGKIEEFKADSAKIFRFGRNPAIIIKTESGEYRAFSAVCTHLDCTVQYRSDLKHIWCACHNGHYDLQGRNVSGPPPKPLAQYMVSIKGSDIYVSKEV